MYPVRGQTILVRAPYIHEFVGDKEGNFGFQLTMRGFVAYASSELKSNGTIAYIIPRPGQEGTVLLGGTFQPNNWDTSYDDETAQAIFAGCAALLPELLDQEKTQILSHNVGLRPAREGGPRVEIEWMQFPLVGNLVSRPDKKVTQKRTVKVVHAYGFGLV